MFGFTACFFRSKPSLLGLVTSTVDNLLHTAPHHEQYTQTHSHQNSFTCTAHLIRGSHSGHTHTQKNFQQE